MLLFKVYYIIMLHYMCIFFHKLLLCDFHVYFLSEFREQPQFSVVKGSSLCVILVFSSYLLTKFNNLRSFEENMILLNIQKKWTKKLRLPLCCAYLVCLWCSQQLQAPFVLVNRHHQSICPSRRCLCSPSTNWKVGGYCPYLSRWTQSSDTGLQASKYIMPG